MNLREVFAEKDEAEVKAFIASICFATFVSSGNDREPVASHLPIDFIPSKGRYGTLISHVANSNAHVQFLTPDRPLLVIIASSSAYVSPSWFSDRSRAPTQAHRVVHCYGRPRRITDREEVRAIMEQQVRSREHGRQGSWNIDELGDAGYQRRLGAISGIEMTIERVLCSFRLLQDESEPRNVLGAIDALERGDNRHLAQAVFSANSERLE